MFLVYLFATLTFAKSSPLFDFGPRDADGADIIRVKPKDLKNVKAWVDRTNLFLDGKKGERFYFNVSSACAW